MQTMRWLVFAIGLFLGVNAGSYLSADKALAGLPHPHSSLSQDNQCTDESLQSPNPNKMLFITCGGFLDS